MNREEGKEEMDIKRIDGPMTVCKLKSTADIDLNKDFYFLGRTDEEISLVCRTEDTPVETLERDDGWRAFRIQGMPFALTAPGLIGFPIRGRSRWFSWILCTINKLLLHMISLLYFEEWGFFVPIH